MTRKPYRLTLAGLAKAFEDKDLWTYVDEVVGNWSELAPLIFGKWEYFKERELAKEATERLRQMFLEEGVLNLKDVRQKAQIPRDYPYHFYDPLLLSRLLVQSEDGSMQSELFAGFFFFPMLHSMFGFSGETWFKAIQDDAGLREWARAFLKGQTTSHRLSSERYEQLLRKLEASED